MTKLILKVTYHIKDAAGGMHYYSDKVLRL